MGVAQIAYKVICAFSLAVQIITFACFFFAYAKLDKVKGVKLSFSGTSLDSEEARTNLLWTSYNAPIVLGVFALVAAVIEFLLIFWGDRLAVLDTPFARGMIYIGLGCAALGVGGDLGLATGILSIVDGVFVSAFGIWNLL